MLNICEGFDPGGKPTRLSLPPLAVQDLEISPAWVVSEPFLAPSNFVRSNCGEKCRVMLISPYTAPDDPALPWGGVQMSADQTEFFSVPAGQNYRLAVRAL